jgi:cell fate (sporulation/competence/biofilm development) regulator YmcA (YheA/YmcA/DUF963 family)
VKKQRMMQAAQGQAAMQQNQMNQQSPSVAAQVMSQPLEPQFYGGGITQGYADGGAIQTDPRVRQILARPPMLRTPEENEYLESKGIQLTRQTVPPNSGVAKLDSALELPSLRSIFAKDSMGLSDEDLAKSNSVGALNERIYRMLGGEQYVPPAPDVGARAERRAGLPSVLANAEDTTFNIDPKNPQAIGQLQAFLRDPNLNHVERAGLQDQLAELMQARLQADESAGTTTAPPSPPAPPPPPGDGTGIAAVRGAPAPARGPGISATLPPEYEALMRAEQERLGAARQLPDELVKARAGLGALETAGIDAQRANAKQVRDEAEEAMRAARELRNSSRLGDIQFIGQMLEGARGGKRFGETLSGAMAGAGRAEGERAKAFREAQKANREDRRAVRSEEAAVRQLETLAQQRKVAEMQGDMQRVESIDAKVAALKLQLITDTQKRADAAAEFGLRERDVGARETAATNRAAGSDDGDMTAEQRLAIARLRASAAYKSATAELEALQTRARYSKDPKVQEALRKVEEKIAAMEASVGLTPVGVTPSATQSTTVIDFAKIP